MQQTCISRAGNNVLASLLATITCVLLLGACTSKPAPTAKSFQDCSDCPEMVMVPAGSFMMGSPDTEHDRDDDEGPQHTVTIARDFAASKYEVTVAQYAVFLKETGRTTDNCDPGWWRQPMFTPDNPKTPAVCVSWEDAKAYVTWLGDKTGKAYRLLSEAEWEYAERGGTTATYYWGEAASQTCNFVPCNTRYEFTAPVGTYPGNAFGLYDMTGNVYEWVEDCWNESYVGAPTDGSAWLDGDCLHRVHRGGSWQSADSEYRSANRNRYFTGIRRTENGIRVALTPGASAKVTIVN